jgi:hypothetical protein
MSRLSSASAVSARLRRRLDLDWAAGIGAQVTGSGEALLRSMTGRVSVVFDELDGPGVRRFLRNRE